jgi:hypothetical protein
MVDLVLTQPILTCLAVKVFLNDLNRFI